MSCTVPIHCGRCWPPWTGSAGDRGSTCRGCPGRAPPALRAASAGDGVVGHALLAAVTGLDDSCLTQALRPAVAANVLRAGGAGYVFRHELIREAVHEYLLPGEHGRLHNRFASAIDADASLVPPGRADIEKAHHWYAGHDCASALPGAREAGRRRGGGGGGGGG